MDWTGKKTIVNGKYRVELWPVDPLMAKRVSKIVREDETEETAELAAQTEASRVSTLIANEEILSYSTGD
jgi:hypothetical protein